MEANELKQPPTYVVKSVDHALRIATMLQLEGSLTVTVVADRLGVAASTAHRLLQTLVYRGFAEQNSDHSYRAGPVLDLVAHPSSRTAHLRSIVLPHLERLVQMTGESANLCVRAGRVARFVASVESAQTLRVSSREGMAFAAHRTTAGLLLLAELSHDDLRDLYEDAEGIEPHDKPDLATLESQLNRIRRAGFALNMNRSERGVVAVGVPLGVTPGRAMAGLSISVPSARYDYNRLPSYVANLRACASAIERDLERQDSGLGAS